MQEFSLKILDNKINCLAETSEFEVKLSSTSLNCTSDSMAAGIQLGTVIVLSVSGWLCDTTSIGGWRSVFYVFGEL